MKTVTQVSAGGVILDPEGRVILTSRRDFHGELRWGLPKGLVDEGETAVQAAMREAKEETGLDVEIERQLPSIDYWFVQPGGDEGRALRVHKFVHFFLMRAVGGSPALHDSETEEVGVFEPEEAVQMASYDSERQLIEAATGSQNR